jgi:hypothetical protein
VQTTAPSFTDHVFVGSALSGTKNEKPDKSLPLKSDVKPSASGWTAAGATSAAVTPANRTAPIRYMTAVDIRYSFVR